MGIRFYKATTPGLRQRVSSDFQMVTQTEPEHSLCTGFHRKKGRNNLGRITSRHRGGGHKRNVRVGR